MKRILVAMFLVACIATTVVGCGSSSSAKTGGDTKAK
jgi:hypothetical protein